MNFKLALASVSLVLGIANIAQALPKGVVYQREGTYSEYPAAFKLKKAATLMLSAQPGPNEAKTIACQLPKDKRIIFAKASNVVTQTTQTGKIQALNEMDYRFEVWQGDSSRQEVVRLQKNEIIEDLSYYAEGSCRFKVRNIEGDGYCLGNEIDESKMKQISSLEVSSSVKIISCLNGTTGWISDADMSNNPNLESFLYNPY